MIHCTSTVGRITIEPNWLYFINRGSENQHQSEAKSVHTENFNDKRSILKYRKNLIQKVVL